MPIALVAREHMKTAEHCYPCLRRLIQLAVSLSAGNRSLVGRSYELLDRLYGPEKSPTEISNRLLAYIRTETGVTDPFSDRKQAEMSKARQAANDYSNLFPSTLEGLLKFASLGNSLDFFADSEYNVTDFRFTGDMEAIEAQIAEGNATVLLFADNVGEFFFDLPLIRFLERQGKHVYYAVKERPVQNDLSMADVEKQGLRAFFDNIVSTGTDEVGIRREQMHGSIKELWDSHALVMAKGMANYESISEFHDERPVLYILKAKCRTVAEALGCTVGEHTSFIGGAHGNEKRLL